MKLRAVPQWLVWRLEANGKHKPKKIPFDPRPDGGVAGAGFDGPDAALLAQAFQARNGPLVRRYWEGDLCGKPSDSEAVLGLAQLLAFWSGPDEARVERLVAGSPLFDQAEVERSKWESRRRSGSWGLVYIVRKAIETCQRFHPGSPSSPGQGLAATSAGWCRRATRS